MIPRRIALKGFLCYRDEQVIDFEYHTRKDPSLLVLEYLPGDECTVDCTTPENLTREEGRGLFLMRQLMDRVESFRNKGNVVRLTLHRE